MRSWDGAGRSTHPSRANAGSTARSSEARVASAALTGDQTANARASEHDIHPLFVRQWMKAAVEGLADVFANRRAARETHTEELPASLCQQIGRLKAELDWLKEGRASPAGARSMLGYEAAGETEENLRLPNERHMRTPFQGVRRMTAWLRIQGHAVNERRVRRLLSVLGMEAVWPKPRLSQLHPEHRACAYGLRGGDDAAQPGRDHRHHPHPSAAELRVPHGGARIVQLSRREPGLSNTLDGGFRRAALEQPEILNTDQGRPSTSSAITGVLEAAGVLIRMDGRGRCLDNVNA